MSKHESWRTRHYWKQVGGLLIEEFPAVRRRKEHSNREIDGVIILGGPNEIKYRVDYDLEGKDIICIQTKAKRIGMYLMGQAFFSIELLKRYNPRSIKSVAICSKADSVLEPICKKYGIEVVVIPDELAPDQ